MNRLHDPRWLLILMFLGSIGLVPLIQTALEMQSEDDIRALELFHRLPTAANLRAYERRLEDANWAARMTRPWIQFAQFALLKDGGEKAVIGTDGWYFYKPGLKYMLSRQNSGHSTKGPSASADPVEAIVDFRDQLAGRGIRLVVMPVPNKESVYPERLTQRAASLRGLMSPNTREFLERLAGAGVEVIDLFKEFERARQAESGREIPLYLSQDTHWSPAGVEVAARATAQRLLSLGLIETGTVSYSGRSAPVQRLGDILRMLQVPQIERGITPETIRTTQIVRSDSGELYEDAGDAEVVVLGDSFARIYQRDEPGSAGFIAHLARELRRPLMSLVNDGGGSTLVRQELSGRPAFLRKKKVVIWEFVERDIALGLEGWKKVQIPPVPAIVAEGTKTAAR